MPAVALAPHQPATSHNTDFLIDFGLAKSDPSLSGDSWILYIQASSPNRDFDGQSILPAALSDALPYFLRNGRITYEHVTQETRHDPSIIIGEPRDARFSVGNCLLVKAELYKLQPKAQTVWNILQSGGTFKASVGGTILKPPVNMGGTEVITKVLLNHIALTPWPVNDDTAVQLMPYAEFLKALSVGSSAPLVREDLEGATYRGLPEFLQRWKGLTSVIQTLAKTHGADLSEEQAKAIALAYMTKRGETRQAMTPGDFSL